MKTMLKYFILPVMASLILTNVGLAQEGDGKSIERTPFKNPNFKSEWKKLIVLKPEGIWKVDMIKKVQEKYIKKLYPDYHVILCIPIKDDKNRFVETLSLMNLAGEKAVIHFDMTEVYKRLKSKDKETKGKIEELEGNYMNFNKISS